MNINNKKYKSIKGGPRAKNNIWSWFWLSSIVLFLVLMTVVTMWSRNDYSSTINQIKESERSNLEIYDIETSDSLDHVFFDLKWLPSQNELQEWLDTENPEVLKKVIKEYLALSESRPFYDQMRLLDDTGQEVFRIGIIDGNSMVVADEDLQNKSNRYYFTDSYQLDKGGLYISPLDLNIEHGQIEVPYKPMIRFVAPVYDRQDNWRGSLVLNYLGNDLIELLKKTSDNALGTLMLLNNDGYWLIAENPEDEWGFMLDDRKDRSFQNEFPETWSVLNRSVSGQILNKDGLFTFTDVNLKERWEESHTHIKNGTVLFPKIIAPASGWTLVSYVSPQTLSGKFTIINRTRTLFLFFTILCTVMASSLYYRERKKQRRHQRELEQMAFYDDLTGLTSRALFVNRLHEVLQNTRREEDRFALLVIDLDGFKDVNDSLGHDGGDQLLCQVADRLRKCVRSTDTIARTGGDEFSIILPRIEDSWAADQVARKILDAIQIAFMIKEKECHIGASIGISVSGQQGSDADTLWKQADMAMYQAKQSGKNRYCCFSPAPVIPGQRMRET